MKPNLADSDLSSRGSLPYVIRVVRAREHNLAVIARAHWIIDIDSLPTTTPYRARSGSR
jgi:hypothetical protein